MRASISEIVQASETMPVQPAERIEFVDIVRGFAVLGILIANIVSFAGYSIELSSQTLFSDRLIAILTRFLVEAKFYSLFSFLFGWGMAVQMARAEARGGKFVPLYLRRTFLLLAIGLIHGLLIWSGDILTLYALLAFLLLAFRKRPEKQLLVAAGVALLLSIALSVPGEAMDAFRTWYDNLSALARPAAPGSPDVYASGTYREITTLRMREFFWANSRILYFFGNVFAMFLLGLYTGRRRILENLREQLPLARKVLWLGLTIGVIFNGIFVLAAAVPDLVPVEYRMLVYRGARTIGAPALMLFYLSGIALLVQKPSWRAHLAPLANVGRGALSNYLFQSIVATLIFYGYGLGLYGEFDPVLGLALAIGIYAAQVRLSAWWFKRFRFGPVEWLWRSLTYRKHQRLVLDVAKAEWRENPTRVRVRTAAERLNTGAVLAASWVVLLIWAGALVTWTVRLDRDMVRASAAVSSSLVTAAATPTAGAPEDHAQAQPSAVSTPAVEPVAYVPSPMAAAGDLVSLAATFDAESALAYITALTGAPHLGRYAGSPEGWAAGDYLAEQFAALGLQPAGDDGTFHQAFPVYYTALAEVPLLAVHGPDGTTRDDYRLNGDFSPILRWYSGEGTAEGEVVWVSTCSREDLALIEVEDKIVLCWDNATPLLEAERNVVEHGAAGLLLFVGADGRPPDFGSTHRETWILEPIPVFRVYSSVVADLLKESGRSVDDLSISFAPFDLITRARMEVETTGAQACPSDGCQGRNVLGVIPGRDREHADEIVVIGAHYDHLGQTPDGTVWPGANDDASGVAVLLEIARNWQEQGYVPRRTVLFAAWDAEEEGLLGSIHYVRHPRYPLRDTVAMIQLDMVGAGGDILSVDGGEQLGDRIRLIAEGMGIAVEMDDSGGSDHVPFRMSGVPASLLIWSHGDDEEPQYHRPMDTPDNIDLEKLGAAANVASIALLGLADGDLAVRDLVAQRAAAIERGDLDGFLATSSVEREASDRLWFADWQAWTGATLEMEASDVRALGRQALASVHLTVTARDMDDNSGTTINQEIEFLHSGDGWRWAGLNLARQPASSPGFTVAYPPEEQDLDQLGQLVAERYEQNATLLGLPSATDVSLLLFPTAASLQIGTLPSTLGGSDSWVGPGEIRLVYSRGITDSLSLDSALVQLALVEAGVSEAAAPWLWEGLPLALRAHTESAGLGANLLSEMQRELIDDGQLQGPVGSWAAVDYLQRRIGWRGVGQFIVALGQACRDELCATAEGLDHALGSAIQMNSTDFETAWQTEWQQRLQQVRSDLDTILTARADAVLSGNEVAFLSTVDPGVPNLIAEERGWFTARGSLESYSLVGEPLALAENGILARITELAGMAESPEIQSSRTILFTSDGQVLRWAGAPMARHDGELVRLLYPEHLSELAETVLQEAETICAQLTSALAFEPSDVLTVKLYDNEDEFRTSVSPAFASTSWTPTWTGGDASVKLLVTSRATMEALRSLLTVELAQRLLYEMGVDSPWLVRGASVYLSRTFDAGRTERATAEYLYPLWRAVSKGNWDSLGSIPPDDFGSEEEWWLDNAQAWDTVRYLVYGFGWDTVAELLHSQDTIEVAVQNEFSQTLPEIESAWAESVLRGHALPDWAETASAFDPERAYEHVTWLASPALTGRQAGTAGAEAAAAYIEERFSEYGLTSVEWTSLETSEQPSSFQQPFSITFSTLLAEPGMELLDASGNLAEMLEYRQDFTLVDGLGHGGSAMGELVWVRDQGFERIELEGKIVVRPLTSAVTEEISWAAEHGAVGLVLVGSAATDRTLLPKVPIQPPSPDEVSLPVVELAQTGYDRLLALTGIARADLRNSPPLLSLGLSARLDVPISVPESRVTTNVLGLLPGSDSVLGKEVIILSAHYDYVGDDPEPLSCSGEVTGAEGQDNGPECAQLNDRRYAGANDDASGIAVLLEIARVFHETGYRPQRSILFAAWGAQELGELGSRYYLDNPAFPLDRTAAVMQLDAVGGGRGYYLEAEGDWRRDGVVLYSMLATSDWIDGRFSLNSELGTSDELPFTEAARPAVLVGWRDASEANWPVQLADEVDPYRLGVTGQIVTLSIMSLAQ